METTLEGWTTINPSSLALSTYSATTSSSSTTGTTTSSSSSSSLESQLGIARPPDRRAMVPKILGLSFLTILTLALGVHAYKAHLHSGKVQNQNHHRELAAAQAVASQQQCRSRGRPGSASISSALFDSVVTAATSTSMSSSVTSPRFITSIRPTASAPSPSHFETSSSSVAASSSPVGSSHGIQSAANAPAAVSTPNAVDRTVTSEDSESSTESTEEADAAADESDSFDNLSALRASSPLTPNGIKAGIAGGDSYPIVKDHIGWWYDWSPTPSKPGKPIAVPMLWGGGKADAQDAARLAAFKKLSTVPVYVLGFEEPDCAPGSGSAGMSVADGVAIWEKYMAPLKAKGAKLGSPSMCKQADETWLAEFAKKIKTPWDITCIHVNKNSLDGVKKDINHYMKYNKPIWVTEFACVADNPSFIPCTNQAQINKFINDVVPYFESNKNIYAYAYSNGLGLGNVWPMGGANGKLSASGKTYLAAISKYH